VSGVDACPLLRLRIHGNETYARKAMTQMDAHAAIMTRERRLRQDGAVVKNSRTQPTFSTPCDRYSRHNGTRDRTADTLKKGTMACSLLTYLDSASVVGV
jgi:hypothetical protein